MAATGASQPPRYRATADDALGDSDMVDLLERLRRREVSPGELHDAATARVMGANEHLNAVAELVPPSHPAASSRPGPFHGVPTALKDNEELLGLPTRQGSRAVPDTPASESAVMTERLLDLGLSLTAKTTMPEFGLTATTESLAYGPTRNPWHLGHSVGGSSGGAAALVAAGALPIAHANDGGGSIRIPAACCGLVGLKPSWGYMPPPERMEKLPVKLSTQGVLTRTVRDTAAFFGAVTPVADDIEPVGQVRGPGHQRLRVAMVTEGIVGTVNPDTRAAVEHAGKILAENGHHVESVAPLVSLDFGRDFLRYWALLAWLISVGGKQMMGPEFDRNALEPFSRGLAGFTSSVAAGIPGSLRRLRRFRHEYRSWFSAYDLILSPVTNAPAPPLGHLGPDLDFRTHALRLLPFAGFTATHNVAGTPAISVPMGLSSGGLPLGVMLAGDYGQERRLIEVAFELEAAHPPATLPS